MEDPFSNPGTSRVFLCIMKGTKNPKAIADSLGIQPPPVIEQLRRLQKIGAIKLGEKIGKEQNYEVKWNEFLALFIERAMQKRKSGRGTLEEDHPENTDEIRALQGNKYFAQLIESYLQKTSEGEPTSWSTISEAIGNFENALRQSASFKRPREFEEREKQEFFNNMRIWYNRTLSAQTWMDICLHDAIYKTLREQ